VPTDSDDFPLARRTPNRVKGIFVLVVPDISSAPTLVLFSSPLRIDESGKPAKEIFRLDLRKLFGPEDVSQTEGEKILNFLNAARTAQNILDERASIDKFTNLQQLLAVKQVGPERFSEIVKILLRRQPLGDDVPT
jgi:Helix-hairpin-helix motif